MALKTLIGVKKINGVEIVDMDELRKKNPHMFVDDAHVDKSWFDKVVAPYYFVFVNHESGTITFKLQNGPIKEAGVNGCQLDMLIAVAEHMIASLNEIHPCRENMLAVNKLQEALMWLERRTRDRTERGVEGTDKP